MEIGLSVGEHTHESSVAKRNIDECLARTAAKLDILGFAASDKELIKSLILASMFVTCVASITHLGPKDTLELIADVIPETFKQHRDGKAWGTQ